MNDLAPIPGHGDRHASETSSALLLPQHAANVAALLKRLELIEYVPGRDPVVATLAALGGLGSNIEKYPEYRYSVAALLQLPAESSGLLDGSEEVQRG